MVKLFFIFFFKGNNAIINGKITGKIMLNWMGINAKWMGKMLMNNGENNANGNNNNNALKIIIIIKKIIILGWNCGI